jgi:phage terminase large subunit GpA-like protein
VLYDTNAWKTLIAARLKLPAADPQAFTIHAGDHAMLLEHLAAEYPVRTEARGRVVDEWRTLPGRDNHWLDCVVGAAVAASYAGVTAVGVDTPRNHRRKVTIPTAPVRKIELRRMGA